MYLDLRGVSNLNPGVGVEDITDAVIASGWMPPLPGAEPAKPTQGKEALISTEGIIPGSESTPEPDATYITDTGTMVTGVEIAKTGTEGTATTGKWYKSGWFIGGVVVLTVAVAGGVYVARHRRS